MTSPRLAASGTSPVTIETARPVSSRRRRTWLTRSGGESTETTEARIESPWKPTSRASGASSSIGMKAWSLRFSSSAMRTESDNFIGHPRRYDTRLLVAGVLADPATDRVQAAALADADQRG